MGEEWSARRRTGLLTAAPAWLERRGVDARELEEEGTSVTRASGCSLERGPAPPTDQMARLSFEEAVRAVRAGAVSGDLASVRRAVEQWPDAATARDNLAGVPLHDAASCGRLGVVDFLLEVAPWTAAAVTDDTRAAPLHGAAENGYPEVVESLLRAAPQVADAPDYHGTVPLSLAALSGNARCVDLLLEAAPRSASSADAWGHTPLHHAFMADKPNPAIVARLAAAAPETIEVADRDCRTPLEFATEAGLDRDLRRVLAEARA